MQTDYYPVLTRAVAALDPNTASERRAIYDRARVAIMDAGLTPQQTHAERSQLESAIARIEHEIATGSVSPVADVDRRSADRSDPARARPLPPEPARGAVSRPWLLIAAAVVLVGLVGYAVWPRPAALDRAPEPRNAGQPAAERGTDGTADSGLSYVYRRQVVYYRSVHPPGTIVINKSQRNLYVVRPNVSAVRYTIGLGRGCSNAVGLLTVSDKRDAAPRLSASAAGAGADAVLSLALGDTGLRIDSVDPPVKDGGEGCFAVTEEDMADLHQRVAVNARVVIN